MNLTNMEALSIYEAIIVLGSLVGVYIKLNNEISKLKNRVYTLEQSKDEVKEMLKDLSEDVAEIKLLLARKQISE
jgi:prefoldin subunit 5